VYLALVFFSDSLYIQIGTKPYAWLLFPYTMLSFLVPQVSTMIPRLCVEKHQFTRYEFVNSALCTNNEHYLWTQRQYKLQIEVFRVVTY